MKILFSLLLLMACHEQQNPPVSDTIFEIKWENRSDSSRSIVGSDYVQLWDDYFIWTGDLEDPLTIKYFNKKNGDLSFEFNNSGILNGSIYYNKLINNIYVGVTGDGVFGFDLDKRIMIWELNLSQLQIRTGWGLTTYDDYIFIPATLFFGNDEEAIERIIKIHYLTGEMETIFELKSKDSLMNAFSAPVFWKDPESGDEVMCFNNQNWNYNLSPQQTTQDMYAVDVETGEIIWSNIEFTQVASNGSIPPIQFEDNIITGGDWSIYSFNAKTGLLNWKKEFPEHKPFSIWGKTQHLIIENRLYVNNDVFDIYCLNANTGELIWHNDKDAPNCTPTMTYYEDKLVYTSWGYGSIMVLDAFTGEKIHQEQSHNNSTFNTDVVYDPETDMFFTTDYLFAYGFKINKPE